MGSQFVDFNADGITDLFTATFDGSPWVAFGSKEGFKQPQQLKDKNGERVLLSQYWDYDAKKWTNLDRTGGVDQDAHCISAVLFDWDADGDFDLVMGDREGYLWLQMNEGSAKEAKFSGQSEKIKSGDKPLYAGDKITAPKLVDWDRDGLTDILVGTFGDTWGMDKGGGVLLFRNHGKKGAPSFQQPRTLIEASPKGQKEPTRPDAGCYVDAVDYDGDGDLDLVVGGYSIFAAEKKDPTPRDREGRQPFVWVYLQNSSAKQAPRR